GEHDQHLARIEQKLGVWITSRGNRLAVSGTADAAHKAKTVLVELYGMIRRGVPVGPAEVDAALRMADLGDERPASDEPVIKTRRKRITPRSPVQAAYIEAMQRYELVLGLGPAGTGKTYLAVCYAVEMLITGRVDRLILSRPAVEAGENLGFLPGDMREKVDPYLRPLYDALYDTMPADQVMKKLESGEIEIAPLAFMRGRTLSNAFVILDEGQNTTPIQMKMFLTRLGENSRMVVTGDLSQVDLPKGVKSGLQDAVDTLAGIDMVSFVQFSERDVVRHQLVSRIVRAYEDRAKGKPAGRGS
ncbi:MAG: PhoH family protein, partial [Alphaproteobacteria bacterium]|nr:PhoH family protein [Alphaproteobacteria bacterium]